MIVAACAAMAGVALADAQVYDMQLSVKTTKCQEGKAKKGWLTSEKLGGGLYEKGDELVYRKQSTTVFKGVLFGCDCNESLAGVWGWCDDPNNTKYGGHWYGLTFWNKYDEFLGGAYDATTLTWDVLQRIGNTGDDLELAFQLDDSANDDTFEFKAAGFGKAVSAYARPTDCNGLADDDANDCDSYIKSASGSFAGWMTSGNICTYCTAAGCDAWEFCVCLGQGADPARTVAYGTWTLKYNKTASKKLRTAGKISAAYSKFPADIKAALIAAGE